MGSSVVPVDEAGSSCEPALGAELIEHSCSHASNGPFIEVAAGGTAIPADVSELHHTFEVQVVGPRPKLLYHAQRDGEHAFMTSVPAEWSISTGGQRLAQHHAFPIAGCPRLTSAVVYALRQGQEYELSVADSAPELSLFVEHLGAFGPEAWLNQCKETDQ
jgi:hypothetical protein